MQNLMAELQKGLGSILRRREQSSGDLKIMHDQRKISGNHAKEQALNYKHDITNQVGWQVLILPAS